MRGKRGHETLHLFKTCTKDECGAYLQYKKNQGKGSKPDGAMPKELPDWRARCVEYMARPSPSGSPYQSDSKGVDQEETVTALLALAGQKVAEAEGCDNDGHVKHSIYDGAGAC